MRGSSSNFGREAARVLIEKMQEGHDVGITPDGPRGPMYVVEPGVLVVTRRNNAPLLLMGGEFTRAWRLVKFIDNNMLTMTRCSTWRSRTNCTSPRFWNSKSRACSPTSVQKRPRPIYTPR